MVFVALTIGATAVDVCAQEVNPNFAQQLELLALKCEQLGLKEQAEITRQWVVPDRDDQQVFYPFLNLDHHRPLGNAPQLQKLW